ncbi:tyrosinase family protein [Flavobacterium amniphilum]|uniref:tyrosinase family protein n=1 Tax=Flavobacterium amniphilum TaxID=1834035 RepID=UPI00202A4BE3|nr:tyrosinase family protein [Flavobacterium amniphilum]MCL9805259.1 tyrosinase family protein [Flavobacterium amniphilum]
MKLHEKIRVRRSLHDVQRDYEAGNKKELDNLMRAWKGVKELPADDPNSFFMIGGYHGEPFRGAGWGNAAYWGGYCNHGNVLFPTWHRIYLLRLEEALQSIAGCGDVMLPFWDETNEESLKNGIPWALTNEKYELDGVEIDNPLRSFTFPKNIVDNISNDVVDYSKPKGYETVRYPLSGLVGPSDIENTIEHNAQFPDYDTNVKILNENIVNWLNSYIVVDGKKILTNVNQKYIDSLYAPNFTVFSNTTSSAEWNDNLPDGEKPVVALESPHNSIHLAVGGCDIPGYDRSPIDGANGDMGENDTAGLDPIFYFHHANVDRVFWLWQKKHGFTDKLEIMAEYPGTNTVDSQGPTPGMAPNSWLTMESPLNPFKKNDGKSYTSLDAINIETQMGYTYGKGSLEEYTTNGLLAAKEEKGESKVLKISRINRGPIKGSFMINAFAMIDGKKQHIGTEAILSRWNVQYCANCQTHIEVKAFIEIPSVASKTLKAKEAVDSSDIVVEVNGRNGFFMSNEAGKMEKSALPAGNQGGFKVEII